METLNKNIIVSLVIFSAVALSICGYMLLPDTLVVQLKSSGQAGNTMPKLIGLAFPLIISVVSAVLYYFNEKRKHLFVAIVGVLIFVFIFVVNL